MFSLLWVLPFGTAFGASILEEHLSDEVLVERRGHVVAEAWAIRASELGSDQIAGLAGGLDHAG